MRKRSRSRTDDAVGFFYSSRKLLNIEHDWRRKANSIVFEHKKGVKKIMLIV